MKNLEKISMYADSKLSIDQLSVVVGGTNNSWTVTVCNNVTGVETRTHWNRADGADGTYCLSHWDEVIQ